jgi:hypothetical protein
MVLLGWIIFLGETFAEFRDGMMQSRTHRSDGYTQGLGCFGITEAESEAELEDFAVARRKVRENFPGLSEPFVRRIVRVRRGMGMVFDGFQAGPAEMFPPPAGAQISGDAEKIPADRTPRTRRRFRKLEEDLLHEIAGLLGASMTPQEIPLQVTGALPEQPV